MGQKRGLQRRDKKNGLRWPRWGCYDGCAEWHAKTRSGMNTSEEQQEWRRLPKRSPREDWTGTGMWWGEMANTYWGKCWGRIYLGKGREDDRKQDGKTRVNEIWKVLDWERERSSVIPATPHDGKSQRKSNTPVTPEARCHCGACTVLINRSGIAMIAVVPSLIAVAPRKAVKTADLHGGTAATLNMFKTSTRSATAGWANPRWDRRGIAMTAVAPPWPLWHRHDRRGTVQEPQ